MEGDSDSFQVAVGVRRGDADAVKDIIERVASRLLLAVRVRGILTVRVIDGDVEKE